MVKIHLDANKYLYLDRQVSKIRWQYSQDLYNDTNILVSSSSSSSLIGKQKLCKAMKSSSRIRIDICEPEIFYIILSYSADHFFPNFMHLSGS